MDLGSDTDSVTCYIGDPRMPMEFSVGTGKDLSLLGPLKILSKKASRPESASSRTGTRSSAIGSSSPLRNRLSTYLTPSNFLQVRIEEMTPETGLLAAVILPQAAGQ